MENQSAAFITRELQDLTAKLVSRYDPVSVICFGSIAAVNHVTGPFQDAPPLPHPHYCLLVITRANTRIDHEMQEFANSNLQGGTVTVLAHGRQATEGYLKKGNRFFLTVLRLGVVLFPANGIPVLPDLPLSETDHQREYKEAEKQCGFHLALAKGFYASAEVCLESNSWNGAAFLVNQSVEQLCLAMNQACLGYRADIHNLDRLLKLCTCYTQELTPYFPKQTCEQKRLYRLLVASYTDARYGGSEFATSSADAFALAATLDEVIKTAEALCRRKLEELKAKAYNTANHQPPALSDLADKHPEMEANNAVKDMGLSPAFDDKQIHETGFSVADQSPSHVKDAGMQASRQNVIDLLIAVVKPAMIYGRWSPDKHWQDPAAYLHLVLVITNDRQGSFKNMEPLIGLARLGDERLTCSLHQYTSLKRILSEGDVFLSPVCVPGKLIYTDGSKAIKPTRPDRIAKLLRKAGVQYRAGMTRANGFLNGARYYKGADAEKAIPCFMLQQAAEITYRTVIQALYSMDIRSHSIMGLKKYIQVCAPVLNQYLPALTDPDRWLITRLEDAYITARYKDTYKIADGSFDLLFTRIEQLINAAITLCDERFPVAAGDTHLTAEDTPGPD